MHHDTGVSNEVYNVVSVLYHALQGAETYGKYAQDAGGNSELQSFFQQVQEEERQRAQRAQQLLADLLNPGS